ncbi:hypothetical protein ACI2LO_16185 [Streptomyces sp. NPDC033754]|uniref:hypothetical protein n=1 Tax=unclassified Streptomyces TaxID=2593676 RepID=UPI0033D02641
MTRTKRFLAGAILAAAVAVGTAMPAPANIHATGYPATENVSVGTNNLHVT